MPVGAAQVLRFTTETTYGVYNSAGHGTSAEAFLRLEGDDAFTVRRTPIYGTIRGADGYNRRVITYNPKYRVAGSLRVSVYPTQAALLLGWALNLTSNDLGSATFDYYDGTRQLAMLGAKCGKISLSSSGIVEDSRLMASIDIVAQATAAPNVNFTTSPAATAFPAEAPYLHQELSGALTIGSSRSKFQTFGLEVSNVLSAPFDDLATISNCTFAGRDVTLTALLQYLAATDRTNFEAFPQAAIALEAIFTKVSPSHTATFNMESTGYLTSIADKVPLGGNTYQQLTAASFWDRTAATDLAFSST